MSYLNVQTRYIYPVEELPPDVKEMWKDDVLRGEEVPDGVDRLEIDGLGAPRVVFKDGSFRSLDRSKMTLLKNAKRRITLTGVVGAVTDYLRKIR